MTVRASGIANAFAGLYAVSPLRKGGAPCYFAGEPIAAPERPVHVIPLIVRSKER